MDTLRSAQRVATVRSNKLWRALRDQSAPRVEESCTTEYRGPNSSFTILL